MLETGGLQEMESPASFLETKCESTSALVCYSETGSGDAWCDVILMYGCQQVEHGI